MTPHGVKPPDSKYVIHHTQQFFCKDSAFPNSSVCVSPPPLLPLPDSKALSFEQHTPLQPDATNERLTKTTTHTNGESQPLMPCLAGVQASSQKLRTQQQQQVTHDLHVSRESAHPNTEQTRQSRVTRTTRRPSIWNHENYNNNNNNDHTIHTTGNTSDKGTHSEPARSLQTRGMDRSMLYRLFYYFGISSSSGGVGTRIGDGPFPSPSPAARSSPGATYTIVACFAFAA